MAEGRPDDALAKLEHALAVASIQVEPGLLAYINLACAQALEVVGRNDDADRRHRRRALRFLAPIRRMPRLV